MERFNLIILKLSFIGLVIIIVFGLISCQAPQNDIQGLVEDDSEHETNELNRELLLATDPGSVDLKGDQIDILLIRAENIPSDTLSASISAGIDDSVRELNFSGGINGAEIHLTEIGFVAESDYAQQEIFKAIDQMDPILILLAYPIGQSFLDDLDQLDIPVLYFGTGKAIPEPESGSIDNLFWLVPPPDYQMAYFLEELWKNWEKLKPSGAFNQLKIGYIGSGSVPGFNEAYPLLHTFIEENNFKFILEENISDGTNRSTTNFLVNAITEGVTVIYNDSSTLGTATLMNDLHSMAVAEFFVVGGGLWTIDQNISENLVSADPLERYLITLPISWWNQSDSVAIQRAKEIQARYSRPSWMQNSGYLIALGAVDITEYVLNRTVQKEQTGSFEGENVIDQLNKLIDYGVMTDLFTVNYSGQEKYPTSLRLWQVSEGGDWIPIGQGGPLPSFDDVD